MRIDATFETSTDPIAMLEARSELRALHAISKSFQPRNLDMLVSNLMGETQKEIARQYLLSQQTTNRCICECKESLRWARHVFIEPKKNEKRHTFKPPKRKFYPSRELLSFTPLPPAKPYAPPAWTKTWWKEHAMKPTRGKLSPQVRGFHPTHSTVDSESIPL